MRQIKFLFLFLFLVFSLSFPKIFSKSSLKIWSTLFNSFHQFQHSHSCNFLNPKGICFILLYCCDLEGKLQEKGLRWYTSSLILRNKDNLRFFKILVGLSLMLFQVFFALKQLYLNKYLSFRKEKHFLKKVELTQILRTISKQDQRLSLTLLLCAFCALST